MFGTGNKLGGTGFGTFGQTTTTPSFGFGTNTAPGTSLLGTQPVSGVPFGTTQPATGLQFGSTPTSTLQFGTTPLSSSNPTFGAAQPTQTGFQLGGGQPAPLTFGNSTSGGTVTFGTATTSTPSLFGTTMSSFGAPTATPNVALGQTPTSSTSSIGFTFGQTKTTGGFTLGTTAAPSFSLATTSAATPAFSFGGSTTTSSSTGFTLGGLMSGSLASSTPTTTTTVGLGGVDASQSRLGLSGSGVTEPKHVKDHVLPDPILQTFNEFQTFIKQQKNLSIDIAHSNSKPLKRVQEEIEELESKLASMTNGLARSTVATEKLKQETAQGLFDADMAQRLREGSSVLGYDKGPDQYFSQLVDRFETDAARLQVQVEAAERHLRSITQSSAISPQELTLAMRRLHESLVVLAARVQSLHVATQSAQQEYRHLRHVYLKEDYPAPPKPAGSRKPNQHSLAGPTAFTETAGVANLSADALSMLSGGTVLAPTSTTSGWGCATPSPGSTLMASPNVSFSSPPLDNTGFQLSRPPVGNKRNKR